MMDSQIKRTYVPLLCNLREGQKCILWWLEEKNPEEEGILVDDQGNVLWFRNRALLKNVANQQNMKIDWEGMFAYPIDQIQQWLEKPDEGIDPDLFLTVWNLFSDISKSSKQDFRGNMKDNLTNTIYDKLFFGNNLPSVTLEGESYHPAWNPSEIERLHLVLSTGIDLFKTHSKEYLAAL